jgi:hypothetical protein
MRDEQNNSDPNMNLTIKQRILASIAILLLGIFLEYIGNFEYPYGLFGAFFIIIMLMLGLLE